MPAGIKTQRSFSMKKNNIFFFGMLVMVLTFGLVFVGCDNGTTSGGSGGGTSGVGTIPAELRGTWVPKNYLTTTTMDFTATEFIMDKWRPDAKVYSASASGNTITVTIAGATAATFTYSIVADELTITGGSGGGQGGDVDSLKEASPWIKK
jgi:hypothetical protein